MFPCFSIPNLLLVFFFLFNLLIYFNFCFYRFVCHALLSKCNIRRLIQRTTILRDLRHFMVFSLFFNFPVIYTSTFDIRSDICMSFVVSYVVAKCRVSFRVTFNMAQSGFRTLRLEHIINLACVPTCGLLPYVLLCTVSTSLYV